MKPTLEIERIEEVKDIERLKTDWNGLLEHNETKTVELTYEWQMTYWKYFNAHARLFILVVKDNDSIVAIAPLKLSYLGKLGIGIRRLEFIAAEESNYQDFIIGGSREEVLECIANYLVRNKDLWDVLSLRHVPETSTTSYFFLNKLDNSLLCRVAGIEKCIYLKIDKTWEEYAAKSRKKRRKIANRMRKLEKIGGKISFFRCSTEEQFRSNLQKFFELHRKRWNQTDTPSQFNDDRYCQFYLDIVPQLLPKKQIDLFVLKAGEAPVSLMISFLFGRNYLTQLATYDTDYAIGSPSNVMWEMFVKQAFSDGIEIIDDGYYYPYKELWSDQFKNRLNIEIYPKRALPYCLYILARMYGPLRANLRRSPFLMKCARYLRRKAKSLVGAHQWSA